MYSYMVAETLSVEYVKKANFNRCLAGEAVMVVKQAIGVGLLTFALAMGASADEGPRKIKKFNDLDVRLLEATDRRDHQNPVFDEALGGDHFGALVYLGQIGGEACDRIRRFLVHASPAARSAAATGLGLCHDVSFGSEMVSAERFDDGDKSALYRALGFSGGETGREFLIRQVNMLAPASLTGDQTKDARALVFGLMQAIVYDRLSPSDLESLDLKHVLSLTRDPRIGGEAAYLLGRVQDLPEVLSPQDVVAAFGAAPTDEIKRGLIRVMRQFGEAASDFLIGQASASSTALRYEAIRGLGQMPDLASGRFLLNAASDPDIHVRHLALTALAGRPGNESAVSDRLVAHLEDPSPWVQVTALRSLMTRNPDVALATAQAWLAGDDYYKAFSAIGLLGQSDEGKAVLEAYAAAHDGTVRGREAAIALDPSIEAAEQPRKSPSWRLVQSYMGRELVLSTSQGSICIAPSHDAPFAAANFMLLADSGKMDGMLWHRVIPNFVAQAGQSEDQSLTTWGMIREEWFAGTHAPGAVGVATAGRDTGSTQFFINTAHNLHLDGRYTVMGQVRHGLDAAYALAEGDVIEKAETVPWGTGCR